MFTQFKEKIQLEKNICQRNGTLSVFSTGMFKRNVTSDIFHERAVSGIN